MAEFWKPVVGYEGLYEVSDQGRIFSVNGTMTGMNPVERKKKYYQEHKEWFRNYKKEWSKQNPEKCRQYSKSYRQRKKSQVN